MKLEWAKTHEIPFIEKKLPNEKILVDNYFITDEPSHVSHFTENTKGEIIKTIKVRGKFENGEPVELVLDVKVRKKENIKKPYILLKNLEKDLPVLHKKGYYNAVLFVPSD